MKARTTILLSASLGVYEPLARPGIELKFSGPIHPAWKLQITVLCNSSTHWRLVRGVPQECLSLQNKLDWNSCRRSALSFSRPSGAPREVFFNPAQHDLRVDPRRPRNEIRRYREFQPVIAENRIVQLGSISRRRCGGLFHTVPTCHIFG